MDSPRRVVVEPELQGRRVLVVGLGRSGLAAARLAAAHGARVTVTDRRAEEDLGDPARVARALGAELRLGAHPADLADAADLIVVSPGVPPGIDLLVRARELSLPIWGEVELAARFCRGRIIGVTGSNGKSTVTTMIGAILQRAGRRYRMGGNLGTPLADLLDGDSVDTLYALELSSFQIETLESLSPTVALVLNLSPDHLDRYPSFDAYAAAKARLLELQEAEDDAVLSADDAASARLDASVRGTLHRFSVRAPVERGGFLDGERLVLRNAAGTLELLRRSDLPLPGEHNVANALAAAVAARIVGCPVAAIAGALAAYRALPHRLERVVEVDGVGFYNDSKATNPDSAVRALTAFAPGRVHLILGGRDKGGDWSVLMEQLPRHAASVLLIGEAAARLRELLPADIPVVECGTLEAALRTAFERARRGDVVLLSPGCASFDQYRNFEHRGETFRRIVLDLAAERGDA